MYCEAALDEENPYLRLPSQINGSSVVLRGIECDLVSRQPLKGDLRLQFNHV